MEYKVVLIELSGIRNSELKELTLQKSINDVTSEGWDLHLVTGAGHENLWAFLNSPSNS